MKKNKTILVVEDEKPLRTALRDKFTREGFTVVEAKNGKDGLATALREQPDLILLDIVMPVMDGMTMLKKLKAENAWAKTVPVIILTNLTSANEQRLQDITATEPSYYLEKTSWKIEDIVEKVKDILQLPA